MTDKRNRKIKSASLPLGADNFKPLLSLFYRKFFGIADFAKNFEILFHHQNPNRHWTRQWPPTNFIYAHEIFHQNDIIALWKNLSIYIFTATTHYCKLCPKFLI